MLRSDFRCWIKGIYKTWVPPNALIWRKIRSRSGSKLQNFFQSSQNSFMKMFEKKIKEEIVVRVCTSLQNACKPVREGIRKLAAPEALAYKNFKRRRCCRIFTTRSSTQWLRMSWNRHSEDAVAEFNNALDAVATDECAIYRRRRCLCWRHRARLRVVRWW